MNNKSEQFIGFPNKPLKGDFWMYPIVMDKYWQSLNGSEQKVLDFILRRTWGFRKSKDRISLSQLEKGVGKLDKGTGLTKPTIIKSLNGLEEKGFIKTIRNRKINEYVLVVKDFNQTCKDNLPIASKDNLHTIDTNTTYNITKEEILSYKSKIKIGKKPFYMREEMRWYKNMWWVLPADGGEWLEFADKESKIEWK